MKAERLVLMAGRFFPRHARPGEENGEPSLASYRYRGPFILPYPPGSADDASPGLLVYGPSPSASSSSSSSSVGLGGSATAASKVHSLAERKRRERINGHLSTLRRMIPNADKQLDKAALLRSVVDEVRMLKRKAVDISRHFTVPAEVNQVLVEEESHELAGNGNGCPLIKASICCDDRPDLFADITEAFHGLRLRAVRAEMASLGGRARHVFVLSSAGGGQEKACLNSLLVSARDVLGKVASTGEVASSELSTKRRRLLHSPYSYVPY